MRFDFGVELATRSLLLHIHGHREMTGINKTQCKFSGPPGTSIKPCPGLGPSRHTPIEQKDSNSAATNILFIIFYQRPELV